MVQINQFTAFHSFYEVVFCLLSGFQAALVASVNPLSKSFFISHAAAQLLAPVIITGFNSLISGSEF